MAQRQGSGEIDVEGRIWRAFGRVDEAANAALLEDEARWSQAFKGAKMVLALLELDDDQLANLVNDLAVDPGADLYPEEV